MKKFLALLLALLLALSLCACGEKPDPAPAGGWRGPYAARGGWGCPG